MIGFFHVVHYYYYRGFCLQRFGVSHWNLAVRIYRGDPGSEHQAQVYRLHPLPLGETHTAVVLVDCILCNIIRRILFIQRQQTSVKYCILF